MSTAPIGRMKQHFPTKKDVPQGWEKITTGKIKVGDKIWNSATAKWQKAGEWEVGFWLAKDCWGVIRKNTHHPRTTIFK